MTEPQQDLASSNKEAGFHTGRVLFISGAHCFHDIFSGFLVPLLPPIISRLRLSLALAGSLTVIQRFPSLFNPFIGLLLDRFALRRVLIVCPLLTATLMCLIGLAPGYLALAAVLLLAGVSISFFHVQAPVVIARLSGPSVGRGMSYFMVGGELARTLAPLIAVGVVSLWSLEGTYRLLPLVAVAAVLAFWKLEPMPAGPPQKEGGSLLLSWRRMRRIYLALLGILTVRGFMTAALVTYLPVFISRKGTGLWFAGISLSVLEAAGTGGTVAAGPLSDLVGRRAMLLAAMVMSPILMLVFLSLDGGWLLCCLLALGIVQFAINPVMLALVQENATESPATANGIYMTMSFVVRSVIAVAVGYLGDRFGLQRTFFYSSVLALVGVPFALALPGGKKMTPSPPG